MHSGSFHRKIQNKASFLITFFSSLALILTSCTPATTAPSQAQVIQTPPASTATQTTVSGNPVVTQGAAGAAGAPVVTPNPNPIVSTPSANPITMAAARLQWLGHSTFVLTSSTGTKILIDPTNNGTGYNIPAQSGVDVVTVSHEHGDHNFVAMASGNSSLILRGLTTGGRDWNAFDQTVKGVRMYSIGAFSVFHDNTSGSQRGRNTIVIFEVDGLRIAHLADLGHTLSAEHLNRIGPVDVVMVPVGGGFTIDAAGATTVVDQLKPKIVIPMHYRTAVTSNTSPLATEAAFLVGKTVQRPGTTTLTISKNTLPAQTTVIVPNYR